jgi:hypothetical protein
MVSVNHRKAIRNVQGASVPCEKASAKLGASVPATGLKLPFAIFQ